MWGLLKEAFLVPKFSYGAVLALWLLLTLLYLFNLHPFVALFGAMVIGYANAQLTEG